MVFATIYDILLILVSKIFYFCYGSNMLTKRMHVNNKSATKFANGVLQGYRLSFSGDSVLWRGATANIVPDSKALVHGVIYSLDQSDVENLDKQEVGYNAIEVQVCKEDNLDEKILCRTYVQKDDYKAVGGDMPSKLYKEVIIKGAQEHNLSTNYIEKVIQSFKDNDITDCGPAGFTL